MSTYLNRLAFLPLLAVALTCGQGGLGEEVGGGNGEAGGNGGEPGEPVDPVCDPGAVETRACGACDSGSESRACRHDGQWSDFGPCMGEEDGYPRRLTDASPICPPYHRPAVFFSPHPDDETLGMGGAIIQHVEAGRDVFVELLTRGEASGVRSTLADGEGCSWHEGEHVYELSADEFAEARVAEFREASALLGVDGVFISDFPDGGLTTVQVRERIAFWITVGGDELSLKGTAGEEDPRASGSPHPDHAAVWEALIGSGFEDVRGYLVSHYVTGAGHSYRNVDIASECEAKREALSAYGKWAPEDGRFAVGHHSTKALFDAAYDDCREFVVVPEQP